MKKVFVISALALVGGLVGAACSGLPGGLPGTGNGGSGGSDVVGAFLPDGVALDVSELPDVDSNARTKGDAALLATSPRERVLLAAARIVHDFHRLADRGLALGALIHKDLTDPTQTQVSGQFTFTARDGSTHQVAYKADFAAFDIGNGVEGSGNAVDAPVAVRVWVDRGAGYVRFMCAMVRTKPSQENLGAGESYIKPGAARPDAPADFQTHVIWDRTDTSHKWNEAFVSGQLHDGLALASGHEQVDVRVEADSTIEKTVRAANDFGDNPYGIQTIQSSVHFKPGSGFALISADATGGGGSISITNQCVSVPDAVLANGGQCDTFDTQDMAFIDLPAGGETDFPAAFPETPTF